MSGDGYRRVAEFRLDAGSVCLDFVATLGRRGLPHGQQVERIATRTRLGQWLVAADLVDGQVPVSPGDLISAVTVREAIDALLRGLLTGGDVTVDADIVNRWAAGPVAVPVFDPRSRPVPPRRRPAGDRGVGPDRPGRGAHRRPARSAACPYL